MKCLSGMVKLPTVLLCLFAFQQLLTCSVQAQVPQQERDALIALYNSTNGPNWTTNTGWLDVAGTECGWYGVACNPSQTSVVSLWLFGNNLSGGIPVILSNLSSLQTLDLRQNRLTGGIPPELGNLSDLRVLSLSGNELSGGIPPQLGNLANLESLYLDTALLSGSIPPELGNLTNLRRLDLSGNQLSGGIPSTLGNLAMLQILNLRGNMLTGGIPAELDILTNLQDLYLGDNQLSGSIPSGLGNLTGLQNLELYGNHLIGNIPPELGNLANLRSLSLWSNQLSGSIPSSLGNLANLQIFELYGNQLSGSIPAALGNPANLQSLMLRSNLLTGSIPGELGNLTQLQNLDLATNQLSGSIPSSLGNLASLQRLWLYENQLTGSIPAQLGNLGNLQSLLLSDNQLSGSIPAQLGNLGNLQSLSLSDNQLSGSIPAELGYISSLQDLYLSHNQLTGSIPSSLGDLTNLRNLDLSSNHLSGIIPPQLGSLTGLLSLSMDGNELTGSIPSSLAALVDLRSLDLSYNALYAADSALIPFLNAKQPGWQDTQTVIPMGISASAQSSSAILVSWTPIFYMQDSGRYEVYSSLVSGGPYTLAGSTSTKSAAYLQLTDLAVGTTYYLYVRTVTDPHANNQNTVTSKNSAQVYATTTSEPGWPTTSITVTTNPPGMTFIADGTSYTTAQTFTWLVASGHTISATTPQGTGLTRYAFASWSDGGAVSHAIIVPESPVTYTANFTTQYKLTTSAYPVGGGVIGTSPAAGDGFYPSGTSVQLTATPNAGYLFTEWMGDLGGSANPQSLVMAGPRSVSAQFTADPGAPSTSITVRTSPPGRTFIADGTSYTTAQTFTWLVGSSHTISTTTPQGTGLTRYAFANWSDGGAASHAIAVPASPATYTANFITQYKLTTNAYPKYGGVISTSPAAGDGFYPIGMSVQLTATPKTGYVFTEWMGDLVGSANPQSLLMTTPQNVSAQFTYPNQTTISLSPPSLMPTSVEGQDAANQSFEIWNSGGGTLNYSISENISWLSCSPTSGLSNGEHDTIQVRYATSGLAVGFYNATIIISAEGAVTKVLMVSLAVFSSKNPKPQVTGIGPAGVEAGSATFDLHVYGQNFVRDSRVWWDGQPLKDGEGREIVPIFLSSRELRVTVPASYVASAKLAAITVFTPEPDGGQSSGVVFNVSSPLPVVTGLTLQSVVAGRPEFKVGIYGANFVKESVAEWNGSPRETEFISGTHLGMKLETSDTAGAGTGIVTVLNPGGRKSNEKSLEVAALTAGSPEIRQLIPDVIDATAGGFTLVVEGSGYVAGSKVEWNGVAKTTRYESADRLSADILSADLGTAEIYFVTVTNPAQAPAGAYTSGLSSNTAVVSNRNRAPLLEGLTPAAVVEGSTGFRLKITGWGYAADKTLVTWNQSALVPTYVNDGELTVDVPADYIKTAGVATVGVENPAPGGGSQTKTFPILEDTGAKESLMYPRLVNEGGGAESTGVVWANLSGKDAKLTAWAYGGGGDLIEGHKITNPVAVTVSAEEQQAIMDWQVFGETFREGKQGWLKLDSTEPGVVGFFMMFNDDVTYTDGANALQQGMKEFIFPEIEDEQEGFTQIHVANPDMEAVTVRFELIDREGSQKGNTVERTIEGHGTMAEPLKELFAETQTLGGDYVKVASDSEVVGFEYMGKKPKYVYGLNGQDAAKGGTVLYGPQYAVGGSEWRTTLSIVNLEDRAGTLTMRLINPEGAQIGTTKQLPIKPKGKLEITDQNFFADSEGQLRTGYVEIWSDGPRLAGDLVFGDPERESMASSLPLVSELAEEMVFGHVVSNELWWTGVALLNPGQEDAAVTVALYEHDGKMIGEKRDTVKAGHQQIGLLWQYFDWLRERNQQGYIRVTSDKGLAGLALFGTNKLDVTSAIPAQPVPGE